MRCPAGESSPDHQGASVSRRRFSGDCCRLERWLNDGEAGVCGIGEGKGDRAVVIELHDSRDGNERRVKSAGAGGDDDVATLERVAPDLERTDVDRSVAAPLCNHGDAAPQQSRRDDVGPVGHEEHARGNGPRIDDPADQAIRRAHRHPDANAVLGSCREDGEAPEAVEGGADDPPGRDSAAIVLTELKRRFELAVFL